MRGSHTHIDCLKQELAWATDSTDLELKNKTVLHLNQYCTHCNVIFSNV